MPNANRRPSPVCVAFPVCHLGMLLLLWALWEAACRCSALWNHLQDVSALSSAVLLTTTGLWGTFCPARNGELNRLNHPQHPPPPPCSVPPACSHSASWGQSSLTTNNSCTSHTSAGVCQTEQQRGVHSIWEYWLPGRRAGEGVQAAPEGRGALCAPRSWMRLPLTTCPEQPLKQIMDDKARIQGKFSELMSEKQLTFLCAG